MGIWDVFMLRPPEKYILGLGNWLSYLCKKYLLSHKSAQHDYFTSIGCCDIEYPYESHFEITSHEISHNLFLSWSVVLESCTTKHSSDTAVLCATFQNEGETEVGVSAALAVNRIMSCPKWRNSCNTVIMQHIKSNEVLIKCCFPTNTPWSEGGMWG